MPTCTLQAPDPSSVRARPQASRAAAGVLAGSVLAFLGIYLAAVWSASGQVWDSTAMVLAQRTLGWSWWPGALLEAVSPVSVAVATLAIALLAAWVGGLRAAAGPVVVVAATIAGSQVLKDLLPRPVWWEVAANSLPSGHVAAVAALVVAAVLVAPARSRPVLVLAGGTLVGAVGLAAMAEGWHRPSDVVAATVLATAVGAASRLPLSRS